LPNGCVKTWLMYLIRTNLLRLATGQLMREQHSALHRPGDLRPQIVPEPA
jgi:hypothetical protein